MRKKFHLLFEKGKEAITLAKFSVLTSILEKSLNFILIPIYTIYLSPSDYGVLGILLVSITWLENFINAPVTNGVTRSYYDPKYKNRIGPIVFSGYSFILFQLFIVFFFYNFMIEEFCIYVLGGLEYIHEAKFFSVAILLFPISNTIESLMRVEGRAKNIAITNLIKFVIVGCSQIYMLVFLGLGLKSMIIGLIIGSLIKIISYALRIIKILKFQFTFSNLSNLLSYGYPLVLAAISGGALGFLERYLIRIHFDLHSVGLYTFAVTIGSITYILFTTPLKFSYVPVIFKMEDDPKNQRYLVSKFCNYSMAYGLFIWLLVSLNSEVIIKLLSSNSQFYASSQFVPQAGMLGVLLGLTTFVSNGLVMKRKPLIVSITSLIKLAIASILLFFLVPKYGILAVPYSLCFSSTIMIIIRGYFSRYYYDQTFEVKKIIFVFIIAIFLFVISEYMKLLSSNLYIDIIINLVITLIFVLIIFYSRFITINERKKLKSTIQNLFFKKKVII